MTRFVFHRLTITGLKKELRRFANCFVKAREGDLFPQSFSDELYDGVAVERAVGELYFSFDKLVPRPEDRDRWVLAAWGSRFVAFKTQIEMLPEAIKLSFFATWSFEPAIYSELATLFPQLKIEGHYDEFNTGDVRCHGGKITWFAAKIEECKEPAP
jgi:hypothetical protein